MLISKIQRFSTHDGAGIRTVVFFKGCPLSCKWCHNPEMQAAKKQILFCPSKCIGCRACETVCNNESHLFNNTHFFDNKKCVGCMLCAEACPSGALETVGIEMTVNEIMAEVMKDYVFYGHNGGITLSGGEPLLHAEECIELLKMAKKSRITTAVETSGYFDPKYIPILSEVTDMFLWDFKDGDDIRHLENTGVSNKQIIKNLFLLDTYKTSIVLRCIMVRGVNMEEYNFNAIADTYKRLKNCIGVELLPYHPYGSSKNEQLGLGNNARLDWIPEKEELETSKERLHQLGVNTAIKHPLKQKFPI